MHNFGVYGIIALIMNRLQKLNYAQIIFPRFRITVVYRGRESSLYYPYIHNIIIPKICLKNYFVGEYYFMKYILRDIYFYEKITFFIYDFYYSAN